MLSETDGGPGAVTPGFMEAIAEIFSLDPDAPALGHGDRWYSYGELSVAVGDLVDRLDELGVGAGSPVALVLPNSPAGVVGLLAVFRLGATALTLSPRRAGAEASAAPATMALVTAHPGAPDDLECAITVEKGADSRVQQFPGVAVLMGTSGTTGEPKRLEVTYESIDASLAGVRALAARNDSSSRGPALKTSVNLVCFPLLHLAGLLPLLITLMTGRRTALMAKFEPLEAARLVREHRISSVALNPTALSMLLDADIDPSDLASLRFARAGSAPLSPEVAERFEERFGTAVLQAYGQTETGGEIVGWRPTDHAEFGAVKRGSVGRPHPGIEIAVVAGASNPDAGILPVGSSGELWARGIRGIEGWHRLGDVGRVDADGFVWIEGRADDLIICGGFNIAPLHVERTLEQHPAVKEAAVVGIPDERLGQIPVAVLATDDGVAADLEEIRGWCRDHLEHYQVPRRFVTVDALPRNEIDKVHRPSVTELATTNLSQ
ncbi:MAG: AMP-binding protein [Acidimicrobiia bacterium]